MTGRTVRRTSPYAAAWTILATAALAVALSADSAAAQPGAWGGSPHGPQPAPHTPHPSQVSQTPPNQRPGAIRPEAVTRLPAAPEAPFQLTPEQQAEVDRVLAAWEQRSNQVRTFSCRFKRWEYDTQWGPADAPKYEDLGAIKYEAPDKGFFRVEQTVGGGQAGPVDPRRAEHWVCDGRSVFQYDYSNKLVTEYRLPPELHGKAIANSPLPFLFGASAENLQQRYFMRIVTPSDKRGQQTWLEAYPKYQSDAANFRAAHLILTNHNMTPFAMNIYSPNGKDRTAYQFYEVVVNDPLSWLKGNPFQGYTPLGWRKVVEDSASEQATRPATAPGR
jgi:TIGR03009 family protein